MKTLVLPLLLAASPLLAAESSPSAALFAPKQNAALIYWRALALLPEITPEQRKLFTRPDAFSELTSADMKTIQKVLESGRESLKELVRADASPYCRWGVVADFHEGTNPISVQLPEIGKIHLLAMLALFQGQVDLEAGNESAAVETMCAAMRLARSYARDTSFYISLRVAQVTDEHVVSIIAAHFSSLSMLGLQRVQDALSCPPPVSLVDALQTESRLFLNWVQAIKAKAEGDSGELPRFREELARAYHEDPKAPYFPKEITLEILREESRILETAWAEVLRLAAMPAPEEGEPMNDYLTKEVTLRYPNSLAQRTIPGFIGGMANQRRAEVSRAALKVAIVLREGGSKLPQEVEDPENGIAFLCKKEGDGFKLEAKRKISGKHFSLHFK